MRYGGRCRQPLNGGPKSILVAALDDPPDGDADVVAVLSG
jgi:hypothetical protein